LPPLEPAKTGTLDVPAAKALAETLSPLLETGYADSLNHLKEIGVLFAPLGKVCGELLRQMESYEFDAAHKTLMRIRGELEEKA
jgi:hypothetical protein